MTQLGKYDIIEEIGRGGFGVVYKAHDRSLERVVALKVLHPQLTVDTRFIENFHREARNLARINHPNVVTVYEIGEIDGRLYIAMEYLAGGSLEDRLKREGTLNIDDAMKVVEEAGAGLAAGHKRDIIHRDIKPGNILFNEDGQAVIGDFGVARAVQLSCLGTTTQSSGTVGTPFYRPPELWRGSPPPSPATDVYSLACVLYEMLTGEVLFSGDTPDQLITKHLLEDAQKLIEARQEPIPAAVKSILEKGLAKDPRERFQDTSSLIEALTIGQVTPQPVAKVDPESAMEKSPVKHKTAQEKLYSKPKQNEPTREAKKHVKFEPQKGDEYQLQLPGVLMMDFVYVPAGEFLMGASEDEESADDNEKPQQKIYLDGYWIGKFPVTNEQYRAFVEDEGGEKQQYSIHLQALQREHHPVVGVSWHQAEKYCKWLSKLSGMSVRLPTEAQWEKAARGTDGYKYPWGDNAPNKKLANFSLFNNNTTQVGSFPSGASPYGALDMAGNVWEWVADWFGEDYYSCSPYKNPTGPSSGNMRGLRGGSWDIAGRSLRVSIRAGYNPDLGIDIFGFRCLLREEP